MADWERIRRYWSRPEVQEKNRAGLELLDMAVAVAGNTGASSQELQALTADEPTDYDVQFPLIDLNERNEPYPAGIARLIMREKDPEATGYALPLFFEVPIGRQERKRRVEEFADVLKELERIAFDECGLEQVHTLVGIDDHLLLKRLTSLGYRQTAVGASVIDGRRMDMQTLTRQAPRKR